MDGKSTNQEEVDGADCSDYLMTGDEHAKEVVIEASESLLDRYKPSVSDYKWDSLTAGWIDQIVG